MSPRCLFIILYFMLSHRCDSLVPSTSVTKGNDISRRSFIAGNIFVGGSLLAGQSPTIAATNTRDSLLKAVDTGASDDVVLALIEDISRNDPSNGGGATSPALSGKWELLWSAKAEAFSPLLALPRPLRPESLQLLGDAAVQSGVGGGRVAQVLKGGILSPFGGAELWLSSGVLPEKDGQQLLRNTDGNTDGNTDVLEILPPFRLELIQPTKSIRKTLVESGSDADFRAANGRNSEAQAAPRNRYRQLYLEDTGKPGDLRISTIISGDPVIVGATFIHRRL
jgi:hypothetical protein